MFLGGCWSPWKLLLSTLIALSYLIVSHMRLFDPTLFLFPSFSLSTLLFGKDLPVPHSVFPESNPVTDCWYCGRLSGLALTPKRTDLDLFCTAESWGPPPNFYYQESILTSSSSKFLVISFNYWIIFVSYCLHERRFIHLTADIHGSGAFSTHKLSPIRLMIYDWRAFPQYTPSGWYHSVNLSI